MSKYIPVKTKRSCVISWRYGLQELFSARFRTTLWFFVPFAAKTHSLCIVMSCFKMQNRACVTLSIVTKGRQSENREGGTETGVWGGGWVRRCVKNVIGNGSSEMRSEQKKSTVFLCLLICAPCRTYKIKLASNFTIGEVFKKDRTSQNSSVLLSKNSSQYTLLFPELSSFSCTTLFDPLPTVFTKNKETQTGKIHWERTGAGNKSPSAYQSPPVWTSLRKESNPRAFKWASTTALENASCHYAKT